VSSVTLCGKFQLCIPKAIREEMSLKAGRKLAIIAKVETILLPPVRPRLGDARDLERPRLQRLS
jgi:AbrB family looped-hinge helix DNA binding protein